MNALILSAAGLLRRRLPGFLICYLVLAIGTAGFACRDKGGPSTSAAVPEPQKPVSTVNPPIILSLLPIESAAAMYERFLPLKYYLEKMLNRPVVLQVAKDYETAMQEIGEGRVQLACLDPVTYCEVRARFQEKVIPLVKPVGRDGARSRSVLAVKQGSGIERVVDAKGKRLALGSPQSSFSYLMPMAILNDVGLKIRDFSAVRYLQQEDRVALSVLIGEYDIGALSETVAQRYTEEGLKVIKVSEPLPQFVLSASSSLSGEIRKTIVAGFANAAEERFFTGLGKDITAFEPAADRDFDVVRVMMKNVIGKDYIEYSEQTIKVAVLPLYSAVALYDRYDPLMRFLSEKTGYEFKLLIPRDFDDFIRVVKSGAVDFSYQNPYIFALINRTMDLSRGLRPLVTTLGEDRSPEEQDGGGAIFRGVIITRENSAIRTLEDLRNKKVLITSPMSAGGFLSQKIFLAKNGIDTDRDLRIVDAKKQENVIFGVYRGDADAGFVRESALIVWKNEIDMNKIRILARTAPLPNWPLAACSNRNPRLQNAVRDILLGLRDKKVLEAARISGFRPAEPADFAELNKY
ncbi:MAG: phosphate/phosphite/phosphonate ABC transporter substrate-binding protein [Thermodesulfovibrio sp.]|nr:phosphate/phosphite/phosphonate ABC transporter substrate-binding protein [Thermodesulfovibrio sp.]